MTQYDFSMQTVVPIVILSMVDVNVKIDIYFVF